MFCEVCYEKVYWSERALSYFHMRGGIEFGTIAREVTMKPLLTPLKPVIPAEKSTTAGFTVPKAIKGRSIEEIRFV